VRRCARECVPLRASAISQKRMSRSRPPPAIEVTPSHGTAPAKVGKRMLNACTFAAIEISGTVANFLADFLP
jgi:hypothetical protein